VRLIDYISSTQAPLGGLSLMDLAHLQHLQAALVYAMGVGGLQNVQEAKENGEAVEMTQEDAVQTEGPQESADEVTVTVSVSDGQQYESAQEYHAPHVHGSMESMVTDEETHPQEDVV
jgi:hypothetical protein